MLYMPLVTQAFIFAFGSVIGSFLNAVLWRLRTRESFIFGRSYCPHCRHELAAVDLVPIFSYLFLGGSCRYCRKAISPAYLAVETVMGVLFLLAALRLEPVAADLYGRLLPRLLLDWYLIAVLVLVFVYDLRYMLILPSVTLPAAAVAFLGNLALGYGWWSLLLGVLIAAGFFYLQLVLSRGRWIGGGDVYLGVLLGAALGWNLTLLTLFLAYVSGACLGVLLIVSKRKTLKSQVPFGTFLAGAAIVSLLYGDGIISWYLNLAI